MDGPTLGLRSLADMVHILMRAHRINELIELAAEHACSALGAATVSISLIDEDHDLIRTLINAGDLGPSEERWPDHEVYRISGDRRLMASLRERRSGVDSVSDPDCEPGERELLTRLGKGCSLTTPIIVDGVVWAEFYATRYVSDGVFDDEAVAYAEVLAAILAAAVARMQREADLEDLAFHDPLTGVFNRRALDNRVAEIFAVPPGVVRCVAIVAVDIDGLKGVNDSEGHASGDRQIQDVAAALTRAFMQLGHSVVARVGGDEFNVLVANRPVEDVVDAINAVCQEVSSAPLAVGVSTGVAAAEITSESALEPSELFAAADLAQYIAKRSRSGVAVVSEEFPG